MFDKFRHIILVGLDAQSRAIELCQHLMEDAFQGLDLGRERIGQLLDRVKNYECQTGGILKELNQEILQGVDRKLENRIQLIDHQLKNIHRCFKPS